MSLVKYKQKRNFSQTPEPKGKISKKNSKKLSYVIQKHAASHLHYDFRLELNGVLLSWAVPKGPCLDSSVKRLAMHVEDHPVEYGSFEGIIPKGQYGGGTVMLWDKGEWIPDEENVVQNYHDGHLKFSLKGKKLRGHWKLFRINKDDKTWLLVKVKDEEEVSIKKYDVTVEEPNSVATNQSMDEIAESYKNIWGKNGIQRRKAEKKRPLKKTLNSAPNKTAHIKINLSPTPIPNEFSPQLATLVDEPPEDKNWVHEIKYDGYRIIAIKKNGKTKLMSRNNKEWTSKFKSIANTIDQLPVHNMILDGELVVLNKDNHPDFQALQNSMKDHTTVQFYYYIFDLPYYDQYNLTTLSLLERKKILQQIIPEKSDCLFFSEHFFGSGKDILKKSCELALEGIISKDSGSTYLQKRTKTWLKSKCLQRQEFVIGGFTKPRGARNYFGSLLIGTYNKHDQLIYNGNVGTGFTESSLKSLHQLLKENISDTNPFTTKPPKLKTITWVKPNLVAEIEFTEWTEDNNLRHPSFKGLRSDKPPKKITKEIPQSLKSIVKNKKPIPLKGETDKFQYKITNPTKILYPEDKITKKDLVEYYEKIAQWILPYITKRLLTLVRCPNGYKECFYQKHLTHSMPNSLTGLMIKEKEGKAESIYIKDMEGLLALPQLGVLEIHPWGSRIEHIEYPDMIIFDLDPAPDLAWKKVVKAAYEIREALAQVKLNSFIKTTGGKGLHIVIPIKPEYPWDEVKNFAHTFVDFLVMNHPNTYIGKMSKAQRKNKIFIDYLRNQRGATAVAPYSTRARLHAPVSTPIDWDELTSDFSDTFFTMHTIFERLNNLKKDPWKDFFKKKQSLNLKKYKAT